MNRTILHLSLIHIWMAYGYQYLYGQEVKAIPYAQRWAELDLSLIHI